MKNTKIITVLLLFLSITTFAQGGKFREKFQQKKDQVKAMKIAFITSELNLTPDEAAKFWPLFNEFEEKQKAIRQDKIKNYIDRSQGSDKLTEKEAQNLLNQMETAEEELHQLRKKFVANLKGVLPATKILKLKKAEEEFSKKLLQQYRDKR
ncbi:MAG: sensor of ECF-type sigma factor [Flavobacteriales bacterium]|nr:sensor of ECF-type sigma factor [Flavobacteriales bacterium]